MKIAYFLVRKPGNLRCAFSFLDEELTALLCLDISAVREMNKQTIKSLKASGLSGNIDQILIAKKQFCTVVTCKTLKDQQEDKWQ